MTPRPVILTGSLSAYDVPRGAPDSPSTIQSKRNEFASHAKDLQGLLRGAVLTEQEPSQTSSPDAQDPSHISDFRESVSLFNGAAPLTVWIVVKPVCVDDISATLRFCNERALSPSIRSGGFSTAGWAIQGDVMLDLRCLNQVRIISARRDSRMGQDHYAEDADDKNPKRRKSEHFAQESEENVVKTFMKNKATYSSSRPSALPDNRSHEASLDDGRWERHHRPPGTSTSELPMRLPKSGGFVWTAGDGKSTQGSTRQLTASESVSLREEMLPVGQASTSIPLNGEGRVVNGSQLHLQQPGSVLSNGFSHNNDANNAKCGPSELTADARFNESTGVFPGYNPLNSSFSQDAPLGPGIHKDKYKLVEFGPGVGVRNLDLFTSNRHHESGSAIPSAKSSISGFSSDYRPHDGKNATHPDEDKVHLRSNGFDFSANGVPYHVPLSAFPVGSTAMTTGGFGYLSRAYGLSLDNIEEVDLVLASGRVVTLNRSSAQSSDPDERDLWWAVRGAAPCFGVVARIVAKAYPVPKVYAGNLIYPFNPATAPSLIRHWRDCLKGTGESTPRELYSNLILTAGPPDETAERHVIVIQVCYLGTSASDEIGPSFVQAMGSWSGERMLLKDIAEKSFLSQQDGVAQVLKSGQGSRWMVRGDSLSTLTDVVIAMTVDQFSRMGGRAVWIFELIGGAIEDGNLHFDKTCVGEAQRHAKFTAAALQQWTERDEDIRCVQGVEDWVHQVLAPVSVGGPFAAFLERGESRSRCEGSFGKDNLQKLINLKRRVDPLGVFSHTFGHGLQEFVENEDEEISDKEARNGNMLAT